jgi:hypothetical protein
MWKYNLDAFLISANGDEWSTSRSSRFAIGNVVPNLLDMTLNSRYRRQGRSSEEENFLLLGIEFPESSPQSVTLLTELRRLTYYVLRPFFDLVHRQC